VMEDTTQVGNLDDEESSSSEISGSENNYVFKEGNLEATENNEVAIEMNSMKNESKITTKNEESRKDIMEKFMHYRWPPTLDTAKFKGMMQMKLWWQDNRRLVPTISILIGIILWIIVGTTAYNVDKPGLSWTAATAVLMAFWWVS